MTPYPTGIAYPTVLTVEVQSKLYIYIFGGERASALTGSDALIDVMRLSPSDQKVDDSTGGGNWYKVGSMNHGGARSIVVPYPGTIWLSHQTKTSITYKTYEAFSQLWNSDFEKTATNKGSVYTPTNYKDDYYCCLGDIFQNHVDYPTKPATLVHALRPDALIHPKAFYKVWSNEGQETEMPLVVYRMAAAKGYTCLGGVGVTDYYAKPKRDKYCCVLDEFLTVGDTKLAWNNSKEAVNHFSAWTIERNQYDNFGFPTGTFIPKQNHLKPTLGYLLKADGFEVAQEKELQLLDVHDIVEVFNDGGTLASKEVSVWKANLPRGYKSLGHIAVNSRNRPLFGYAITSTIDTAFKEPLGFELIWRHESPLRTIWKPLCLEGYGAVGHIGTISESISDAEKPELITCIRSDLLISSENWKKVWTDSGTLQSSNDFALYSLEALYKDEIGCQTMFGIGSYDTHPSNGFLLNADNVNLVNN